MATDHLHASVSQLSLSSSTSQNDDWDRWVRESPSQASQNSVQFPGSGDPQDQPTAAGTGKGKRTLSELLKLHAERGTDVNFTAEEADRVAEVLGQWINSSSSPYEAEDDFFAHPHSQDDSSLPSKRGASDLPGRPRGQSESVVRLPS